MQAPEKPRFRSVPENKIVPARNWTIRGCPTFIVHSAVSETSEFPPFESALVPLRPRWKATGKPLATLDQLSMIVGRVGWMAKNLSRCFGEICGV
jgi:hypothetical protein